MPIELTSNIVPKNNGSFPTHEALYGRGGRREVDTITDRDGIPGSRRTSGMQVYVREDLKTYVLGTNLLTWIEDPLATRLTAVESTLSGLSKASVGLSNVDNVSDANKPISTAQQTALDLKVTGPSSAIDNALMLFSGTSGKLSKAGPLVADLLGPYYGAVSTPVSYSGAASDGFSSIRYLGRDIVVAGRHGLAGEAGKIYRSTDAGTTFTSVGTITGLTGVSVYGFGNNENVVLAGTGEQGTPCLLRSTDFGATWSVNKTTAELATLTGASASDLKSVYRVIHKGGGVWMAFIRNDTATPATNVYIIRSEDNGVTWSAVVTTGLLSSARAVADMSDGRLLYSGPAFTVQETQGLYMSVDLGLTWTRPGTFKAYGTPCEIGTGVYLVGTTATGNPATVQIYKSSDFGATWASVFSVNIASGFGYINYIQRIADGIAIAYTSSSEASQSDRLAKAFITQDYGVTWTDLGAVLSSGSTNANAVYAGTTLDNGSYLLAAQPDLLINKVVLPNKTNLLLGTQQINVRRISSSFGNSPRYLGVFDWQLRPLTGLRVGDIITIRNVGIPRWDAYWSGTKWISKQVVDMGTPASISGIASTSPQKLISTLIPGGLMAAFRRYRITIGISKSGVTDSANNMILKFGPTDTDADSNARSLFGISAANRSQGSMYELAYVNDTALRILGANLTTSAFSGGGSASSSGGTPGVNSMSVDNYFGVWTTMSGTTDIVTLVGYALEFIP